MENKPNNPNAFPYSNENDADYKRGMTLRDYFANSAMNGWLSNPNMTIKTMEELSIESYRVADEMLKQRELLNN